MNWKLLTLLLLAGCSYSSTVDFNPHSGTRGLELQVMDFTQKEVYVGKEFVLGVKATNYGAEDLITKLTINTEKGLFTPSSLSQTLILEGKETLLSNPGESEIITFTANSNAIPATESLDTTIFIDACYSYETKFSAPVCINPDLTGTQDIPRGCPSSTQSFSGGHGAPIVVDKLETILRPSSSGIIPIFKISVRNRDRGTVYEKSNTERACSNLGITKDIWGYIDVNNIYLGSDLLKCSNNQLKTKKSEKKNEFYQETSITCEGNPIFEPQAYTGVLTATLSYGYKISEKQDIRVKRVN